MVLVLKRIAILLSSTFMALITGTLYLYSAFSPQLALQLKYSTSDASRIVMVGSVGSFLVGPPVGLIIDRFGYSISLLIGGTCLVSGYYGLQYQFDHTFSDVSLSSFFLFLVGTGSTFISSSCIKKCAVNFPTIRGVATSLPISMIGLSASFYSIIGSSLYPGDTSAFLGFLWVSSLVIFLLCFPFICSSDIHNHHYHVPAGRTSIESQSIELEEMRAAVPIKSVTSITSSSSPAYQNMAAPKTQPNILENDITGMNLIKNIDFWLLCVILCIYAGMGQMFIYSVGYIVKALFGDSKFILSFKDLKDYEMLLQQNQQLQVTMISISNSIGRISGGVLGDIITNSWNKSRSYLLFLSTSFLTATQFALYFNKDLHHLWYLSLIIGFFYGFNYSIYPTLVGDRFGMKSFSFNYGVVGMSPIISNYLLNRQFGRQYDSKISKVTLTEKTDLVEGGVIYVCELGNRCYNGVFSLTGLLAILGFAFVSILNYRQYISEQHAYHMLPKTT